MEFNQFGIIIRETNLLGMLVCPLKRAVEMKRDHSCIDDDYRLQRVTDYGIIGFLLIGRFERLSIYRNDTESLTESDPESEIYDYASGI